MLSTVYVAPAAGVVNVTIGDVASRLMTTLLDAVPPALIAWQVSVSPAVSLETVVGRHPAVAVIADSASATVQLALALPKYQPLLPSTPLTLEPITGGVLSTIANA